MSLWNDNAVQYPRLLAEINITIDFTEEQLNALCLSMDLTLEEIHELFNRANDEWEELLDKTVSP